MLNSKELKLFLFFFLVFLLFAHWIGWNENSRLDLTRSVTEENRLEIDKYVNNTGDRSYYQSHYYSDKAPGTSFLFTPFYWTIDKIGVYNESGAQGYLRQERGNTSLYRPIGTKFRLKTSRIAAIVFFSSLLGSILLILVYRASKLLFSRRTALITTLSLGTGTIILAYSTVFMGAITAAFFSFFSFYIILKIEKDSLTIPFYYLAGLLAGFSVLIEYHTLLITFLLPVYILSKRDIANAKRYLIGTGVGLLPLFIYNYAIFSNPLSFPPSYIDTNLYPLAGLSTLDLGSILTISNFKLGNFTFVLPRLLFYPFRGLLFYCPVLLGAAIGLYYLKKSDKSLFSFLLLLSLSFLIFNSCYSYWFAGSSFGPRYLLPLIPFLALPLALFVEKTDSRKPYLYLFLFILSLSICHNLLAFNSWQGVPEEVGDYYSRLNSAEPIANPIYKHYLPKFAKNGPRSQLLAIIANFGHDLTYLRPYQRNIVIKSFSFGILSLRTALLPFMIILILIASIWRKEIQSLLRKIMKGWSHPTKAYYLLTILPLAVLILLSLNVGDVAYGQGFLPQKDGGGERWSSQNGTLLLYSQEDQRTNINLSLKSYPPGRSLNISLNGLDLGRYHIEESKENILLPNANLKRGINNLKVKSQEKCLRPVHRNNSSDPRCLSFALGRVELVESARLIPGAKDGINVIYYKNWFPEEASKSGGERWSSQNGTLLLYSGEDQRTNINLSLKSYPPGRQLGLTLNDKKLGDWQLRKAEDWILLPNVTLHQGANKLKIRSEAGCISPAARNNSSDFRCLSFAVGTVESLSSQQLATRAENKQTVIYHRNWYSANPSDNYSSRWSAKDPSLLIYSNRTTNNTLLNFTLNSYAPYQQLALYLNGRKVNSYFVSEFKTKFLTPPLVLKKGFNKMSLVTGNCTTRSQLETNESRCLGIQLIKLDFLSDSNPTADRPQDYTVINAYPWETIGNERALTLTNDSKITLNPTTDLFRLKMEALDAPEAEEINLLARGQRLAQLAFETQSVSKNLPLIATEGKMNIGLDVGSCRQIKGTKPAKCLAAFIKNLTISKEKSILEAINGDRKNWFSLEKEEKGSFRWMSNNGTLSIFTNEDDYQLLLNLTSYHRNRSLQVFRDKKLLGEEDIAPAQYKQLSLSLERGLNHLKFVSTADCDVPTLVAASEDQRCLTFKFRLLEVKK